MSNHSEQNDDSLLRRYLALKTLRDNIYYQHPGKYSFTDVAEDVPSSLQSTVPYLKESIPSLATISSDPSERAEQIGKAIDRIKHSKGGKQNALGQAAENALKLGLISLPAGFLVGGGARLLGARLPMNMWGELRSPIQLGKNLKRFTESPDFRARLARHSFDDAKQNSLFAAGAGALTPIISSEAAPSDKDLSAAANIIQNHPYATALPGGEISALVNSYQSGDASSDNTARSLAAGGTVGASAGAAATFLGPGRDALKRLLGTKIQQIEPGMAGIQYPALRKLTYPFLRAARGSLLRNGLIGAGVGLGAGYLATRPPVDNHTQDSQPYEA